MRPVFALILVTIAAIQDAGFVGVVQGSGVADYDSNINLPIFKIDRILNKVQKHTLIVESNASLFAVRGGEHIRINHNSNSNEEEQHYKYLGFEGEEVTCYLLEALDIACAKPTVMRLDPDNSDVIQSIGPIVTVREAIEMLQEWKGRVVGAGRQWLPTEEERQQQQQQQYLYDKIDTKAFVAFALVDIITGNSVRPGNSFMLLKDVHSEKYAPSPLISEYATATLLTVPSPSKFLNFFPSYIGVGITAPWMAAGTIANVLHEGKEIEDSMLFYILKQIKNHNTALNLAKEMKSIFNSSFIENLVSKIDVIVVTSDRRSDSNSEKYLCHLPEWAENTVGANFEEIFPSIASRDVRQLYKCIAARKHELAQILNYRIQNLHEALSYYFDNDLANEKYVEAKESLGYLFPADQLQMLRSVLVDRLSSTHKASIVNNIEELFAQL